jgi:DNA-binding PadR family transcriptional regulator
MGVSKIEMALLGMIAKKPSYAYEIDQFIKKTHMRRWVQIGSASVYQGLDRLQKKGLASSRREKEGKMPPRRRYYINDQGLAALAGAASGLLSRSEDHYLDLTLGLFCSHVLQDKDIPPLMEARLREVGRRCREIEVHRKIVDDDTIWQQEAILSILTDFCRTEQQLLKKMVGKLKKKQG